MIFLTENNKGEYNSTRIKIFDSNEKEAWELAEFMAAIMNLKVIGILIKEFEL